MAFADTGVRYIIAGYGACKVTLSRHCQTGDILGIAEDNLDDLGPANCDSSGHATSIAYLPRLVAGQYGEVSEVITAYPIAVVGGYSGGTLGKKMYASGSTTGAGTSSIVGQISESQCGTTGGCCSSVIGIMLDADKCLLFPCARKHHDAVT